MKALEGLVDPYIRDIVMLGQRLHWNQHSYQAGFSCMTALNDLANRAEDAMQKGGCLS